MWQAGRGCYSCTGAVELLEAEHAGGAESNEVCTCTGVGRLPWVCRALCAGAEAALEVAGG